MTDTSERYARDRQFWNVLGRAVLIGVIAGAGALAFTQVVRLGTDLLWPDTSELGWMQGSWTAVGILTATGIAVGLMRVVLAVPDDLSGSLTIIQDSSVDRTSALQAIAVSAVSLIGGVSLGPFDGGVRSGATVGDWYTSLRGSSDDDRQTNTSLGINGALGGLLTAPILATLLVTELRWPDRNHLYRELLPNLAASISGFVIFFAIVGDTFLGVFELPGFDVELWHFALAVALGILASAIAWTLGLTMALLRRSVMPHIASVVVRTTLGGLVLGLIAVAMPLTLASGKTQLAYATENVGALSAALLVGLVALKILAVAISLTSGFIGGPVMPTLFIGGAAGLAVHAVFPDIPVALAVSAMLVAVPGVSIKAPFSMVLLAVLTVGLGAVETVPAAIAVFTAYIVTEGLGWFGLPIEITTVDIEEVDIQSQLFDVTAEVED